MLSFHKLKLFLDREKFSFEKLILKDIIKRNDLERLKSE
jgi:hypothetical protein